MLESFFEIKQCIDEDKFPKLNQKIGKYLKNYDFIHVDNQLNFDLNPKIYQYLKESEIILINKYQSSNQTNEDCFFIIGFKFTIMIIKRSSLSLLYELFTSKHGLNILLLPNVKDDFDKNINIKYQEIDLSTTFLQEVDNFNKKLIFKGKNPAIKKIWSTIIPCISGYLIKQSYSKLNKDRINNFIKTSNPLIDTIEENDIIKLRNIGIGTLFSVDLFYHIEYEELIAIKKPVGNDLEIQKLFDREIDNYTKINHPFIPKFYGINRSNMYIATEYINGKTLLDIENMNLDDNDKITIIFQLMIIIEFLHRHNFIYRDLKPNNVMIDQNKTVVLIDFDRMIDANSISSNDCLTTEFSSAFAAPDVNTYSCSNKSDIYSLGKVINYIMNGNKRSINHLDDLEFDEKFWEMKRLYKMCTQNNPEKRPAISELILEFYVFYRLQINSKYLNKLYDPEICTLIKNVCTKNVKMHQFTILGIFYYVNQGIQPNITKSINYYTLGIEHKDPEAYLFLGIIFSNGKYIKSDMQKAIHYFSVAAEMKNLNAQKILGQIYSEGKSAPFDSNKAIYYYSLASDQNDAESQYKLYLLYSDSIVNDMQKAINYLILAADQYHPLASYNLGVYYYEGVYLKQNINRAMHYVQIAENQNDFKAQYFLGYIYFEGKYVTRDINKALRYFLLSANQNYIEAQYILGFIYSSDQFVKRDIQKAIHFYTLAANQNHRQAYNDLGYIFSSGIDIQVDIKKAIHYYMTAANLNEPIAQLTLGKFYLFGSKVKFDITKAIHYLSLASNNNSAEAQNLLSSIYYEGEYVSRDIKKAIYYCTLAANNDFLIAQIKLGGVYYEGEVVPRDYSKAIYYFSLASKKNDPQSQFFLGLIYQDDTDSHYDINKAIYYYSLSAKQNYVSAQMKLFKLYFKGEKVAYNIDKAIYYLTLAAKQNYDQAQYILGSIYHRSYKVPRDISKAIYYYSLASNQNHAEAQTNLSGIYFEGVGVKQDINKAIYYCTLAANQNLPRAEYNLGAIFFHTNNIDKAIDYFTQSANQGFAEAQSSLGFIYHKGEYIQSDMNKAIHYYTMGAIQNHPISLYFLGIIYIEGKYVNRDIKCCIDMLTKSAKQGNIDANFALGFIYHEGSIIDSDIEKAIHYYKYASSLNSIYAKNNLGVIYMKGIENKIKKDLSKSIEYFEETIKKENDYLSMFNLASIYIFDNDIGKDLDKSIDLLVQSSLGGFFFSLQLLALILLKECKYNTDVLKQKIEKNSKIPLMIQLRIFQEITENHFYISEICDSMIEFYKDLNFIYNYKMEFINNNSSTNNMRNDLNRHINVGNCNNISKKVEISSVFFEGFDR